MIITQFWPLTAFAFVVAVVAVAYYRFTQPGEILSVWAMLVHTAYQTGITWIANRHGDGKGSASENHYYLKYEWILKPILTCEKCIAGQLALWLYMLVMPFHFLGWLYVIALASYLASFLLNRL